MNGPPRGSNITSDQSSYDIIFKDIIVKSENRNVTIYPNPNSYTVNLSESVDKLYKAELISVNVPAATDITVNVTSTANRLYFAYTTDTSGFYGYIKIQAGTYLSPSTVASEVQRQFNIVTSGIIASYNSNLNRYIFVVPSGNTLTLYPTNGTSFDSYTVQYSLAETLVLYSDPSFCTTQSINIVDDANGNLEVIPASSSGYYGNVNGNSTTTDSQFMNTIASNLVLTNCNIYLSLGKMNSNNIQFVSNNNPYMPSNISSIFCEIPNNTVVSSSSVKTLLNQPSVWSSENFYNPPLSEIRKLEITWYDELGSLININEHCFTLRVHYLQKRNQSTAFSVPLFTYSGTGTVDSVFQPTSQFR
jgi:hypothetical protein